MLYKKKKKLRIGFFIPAFYPAWRFGGSLKSTFELGKHLAEKGHQIWIFCTDVSNNPSQRIKKKKIKKNGMNIIYFKNISNYLALRYNFYFPTNMRYYLASILQKLDIVHIHSIYNITSFWIYKKIKNTNKPFFISSKGELSSFSQKKHRFIKEIFNKSILNILKRANLTFAQTLQRLFLNL